jgi:hypothetical protein
MVGYGLALLSSLSYTLIKNELIPMPNFTRLREVDRVIGFEPTTSVTTAA